jgi:hypothetical protein
MKLLTILIALILGDPTKNIQGDSISSPTWLEEEWNKSQTELVIEQSD